MARLIYVFLAFALGTLVAGFLVRDSSLPLYFSIGLSGLVLVMILFGTSRRLRRDAEDIVDETELAELEIVELDEEPEAAAAEAEPTVSMPPRKRPSRPRSAQRPPRPGPEETPDEAEPTVVVPAPSAPSRRRRGATAAPGDAFASGEDETGPAPTIQIDEPPPPRRRRPRVSGRPSGRIEESAGAQPAAPARKVWVIPGRSRYHVRSCRFAKGDQLREVTETTARRRGYVPCSVCNPDQAPD